MSQDKNPDDATHDVTMLCAADYPSEEVEWLWPGRIPIGKVTLLVGDPGSGKSLVALDVASRVSRGTPWPDELNTSPQYSGEGSVGLPPSPGSVFILSVEDDLRDTIRPRLDAAEADPSRIYVLPGIVDLRHDLHKLRTALSRVPDCRLIIVDSINAYVGPGDSHFHTIVRRVFQPLAELAAEHSLAVLAISHLRKTEGAAVQRAAGSMGLVAAARSVWTVCRDKSQAGRLLLLPIKNNLIADVPGLAYRIEAPATSRNMAPAIAWQAGVVSTSAEEALDPENKFRDLEMTELNRAAAWLREELADGAMPAMYILAEGILGGFSERTLRRALDWIGGQTKKDGYRGGWIWELPDSEGAASPDSPCSNEGDPAESLASSVDFGPFEKNKGNPWPLRENPEENIFFPSGPVMSEVRYLDPPPKFVEGRSSA